MYCTRLFGVFTINVITLKHSVTDKVSFQVFTFGLLLTQSKPYYVLCLLTAARTKDCCLLILNLHADLLLLVLI